MEIAEQIKTRRTAQNLSQSQLSERSGVPQGRISQYERGELEPTIGTLIALSNTLGPFVIGGHDREFTTSSDTIVTVDALGRVLIEDGGGSQVFDSIADAIAECRTMIESGDDEWWIDDRKEIAAWLGDPT